MIENLVWTDELVEILKAKWADGASATMIASEMMITRSAVLGKVFRLKLTKRRTSQPKPSERPYKRRKTPFRPQEPTCSFSPGIDGLALRSIFVCCFAPGRSTRSMPVSAQRSRTRVLCSAVRRPTRPIAIGIARFATSTAASLLARNLSLTPRLNQRKHVQSLIEQVMGVES